MKDVKILVRLDCFLDSYNFYPHFAENFDCYLLNEIPASRFVVF